MALHDQYYGSASNSSHFITDLGKGASDKLGRRFRCIALNDNISWITALGNVPLIPAIVEPFIRSKI